MPSTLARPTRTVALALSGVLVAGIGLIASPAVAATPDDAHPDAAPASASAAAVQVPVGDPWIYREEALTLRNAVGPATRDVTVDIGDLPAPVEPVLCLLDDGHDEEGEPPWPRFWIEPAQWIADPTLHFGAGAFGGWDEYYLMCRSGQEPPGGTGWRLDWRLGAVSDAPVAVTIGRAPPAHLDDLTIEQNYGEHPAGPAVLDPVVLAPGQTVEVTSAPGSFLAGRYEARLTLGPPNAWFHLVPFSGQASADGSVLRATIPTGDDLEQFLGQPAWLQFVAWTELTPAPDRTSRVVVVTLPTTIVESTPATSTRLALSSRLATTRSAVKAIVAVESADGSPPVGAIRLRIDGRLLPDVTLSAARSGRVVITLPPLQRGRHRVTAEFLPSPGFASSKSAASTVVVI